MTPDDRDRVRAVLDEVVAWATSARDFAARGELYRALVRTGWTVDAGRRAAAVLAAVVDAAPDEALGPPEPGGAP